MTLRQQVAAINSSAIVNAVASAFLIGFGFTAAEHLVGDRFDIVAILLHFTNRAWLLQFLQDSFNAAAIAAIGVLRTNLFTTPSPTVPTLTSFPKQP